MGFIHFSPLKLMISCFQRGFGEIGDCDLIEGEISGRMFVFYEGNFYPVSQSFLESQIIFVDEGIARYHLLVVKNYIENFFN